MMDENQNEIGGGDGPHFQMWLHNSAKSIVDKNDPGQVSTSGLPSDEFNTSFQKLKDLHRELVSGFTESKREEEKGKTGSSPDAKSKKEEVKLRLHVNKFHAPTPLNGLSAKASQWKEVVGILDKKERDKELARLTLATQVSNYKAQYHLLLKEHQEFKTSVQRSMSSCKNEVGITIESLLEAHKDSLAGVRKENEDLLAQLQNAKREIMNLECRTVSLENELGQVKDHYNQKCKELEENHLTDIMVKSKCEGLNQAQSVLYEHMTAAEQRNDVYKAQLADLIHHNASLLDTIGKISDESSKKVGQLKEQIDSVVTEGREEREAFTATISELTEAFQYQVEYTKTVVARAKERESEYEEAQHSLASYIGRIIKECSTTVTFLEKGVKAGEGAKQLLEKENQELLQRLKEKEKECQKDMTTLVCPKCQLLSETKPSEPEPGMDTVRALSRISELERLRDETIGQIQRTQVKYRKLFEKYTRCKEASAKKGEVIKTLQKYSRSLEMELQPHFNEQMHKLTEEMEEAQLKHAQFQALLLGIQDESQPKCFPLFEDEPLSKTKELND